jgi:hypothetical protein
MKGKIVRGRGFRGCLNYLLADHKGAEIIGGNMVGRDPKALAKEFANVRSLRNDCEKPVLHIALRMPDGEDVSAEEWLRIALRLLRLMGLPLDRPWLLVKHPDQHVHILISRIAFGGGLWLGRWEALKLIQATQIIEREFGLTLTPGRGGRNKKQVRLTSGQLRKIQREVERGEVPEVPVKIAIAERIEKALVESNGTFEDFRARLEKLGVTTRLNLAKTTNHVYGISFTYEGLTMKGSKVARAYSWQGLQELLAERKKYYENPGTPQQGIQLGPQPDDRRADHPKPSNASQRLGPSGNRPPSGSLPTPPRNPLAVDGNRNGVAGAGPDLLLSLLGKPSVATAVGAGPGAIIATPGKSGHPRRRPAEDFTVDDGPDPEPDRPTLS